MMKVEAYNGHDDAIMTRKMSTNDYFPKSLAMYRMYAFHWKANT